MIDIKTLYIFMLGVLLTLLYHIEQMIEEEEHKAKGFWTMCALLFTKASIGGILIILIYYTLLEFNIEFTLLNMNVKFGEWTNLFIAGTFSLFGSDMFKMVKIRAEKAINKGESQ